MFTVFASIVLLMIMFSLPTSANVSNVSVEVYNDGSIRLKINGTYKLEQGINGTGDLNAYVDIRDNGLYIDVDGYVRPLEENKANVSMDVLLDSTVHYTEEEGVIEGKLVLGIDSEEYFLNASTEYRIRSYKSSYTSTIDLNITLTGSEFIKGMLSLYLLQLDKDRINEELKNQGIDWISVERFNKNIDDKIVISTLLMIDYRKYAEYLANSAKEAGYQNVTADDYLSSYENSFFNYETTIKIVFKAHKDLITLNATIDASFNWNEIYEKLSSINKSIAPPLYPVAPITQTPIPSILSPSTPHGVSPEEFTDFEDILNTTINILQSFELVPSDASIKIHVERDTIDYEVYTPRFKAKGTNDPSVTLDLLVSSVEKLMNKMAEKKVGTEIESLYESNVTLVPMAGVKVNTTNVKFNEVSQVGVVKEEEATETTAGFNTEDVAAIVIIILVLVLAALAIKMMFKK